MKRERIRYYSEYTDDFDLTANQDFKLPENYEWVKKGFFSRVLSGVVYAAALIFGGLYCKCFLHVKIKGKKKLRKAKDGFFIYGNHTQPVGDVFIPALCAFPKRIRTVVSTANYGIPVIGKILPYLGALPVVNSLHGMKELNKAIEYRIKKGNPVVIYPEAHVWEYYTGIRPFAATSFTYPVKLEKSVYTATVTYKKSKFFKRPRAEVFIDGPFLGEGQTVKEKAASLRDQVFSKMNERAKNSDFEFIKYEKREK